ncbi:MAG: L-aspartate oxidase [Gammaproteobacteria bacterium]|nr:L-aspartate oxidase [Gammaproteobacteria bacterium]
MSPQYATDVLIIGSGAAGLSLALQLAQEARVSVLSKAGMEEGCTLYAQGGIAAVLDEHDSIDSHVEDTLNAGANLCDAGVVQYVAEHSRAAIEQLISEGVNFTREQDGKHYHLTREGGHSHRRIIHAADATGQAVEKTLLEQARSHPNITLYEAHLAIDLITRTKLGGEDNRVLGAYVYNRHSGHVEVFRSRFVVLATGGASKVYLYTSNPDLSTGDGIAMAWRAGCRVANMEFNQFHPTCLYHPKAKTFLITEAVRGEGGRLLLPDGSRFMHRFDPREELAPRDIVARAIDHEMKRLGAECIYLDISHKPTTFIKEHFPTVYARCLEFGIDMSREPIPVVPAAHYTCGGVMTDIHGRTDLPGLYAVGEVTFTGLHGANRMASNSLLECLVFGSAAARHINEQLEQSEIPGELPYWDESRVTDSDEEVVVSHNWEELRRFMWDYVGIVRTDKRLQRAKRRVDLLSTEIHEYYSNFRVTNDLLELRNLVVVADLIIRSAMARKESRGLHYTLDYPEFDLSQPPHNTVLVPANYNAS